MLKKHNGISKDIFTTYLLDEKWFSLIDHGIIDVE
jgi:hypothetical protein